MRKVLLALVGLFALSACAHADPYTAESLYTSFFTAVNIQFTSSTTFITTTYQFSLPMVVSPSSYTCQILSSTICYISLTFDDVPVSFNGGPTQLDTIIIGGIENDLLIENGTAAVFDVPEVPLSVPFIGSSNFQFISGKYSSVNFLGDRYFTITDDDPVQENLVPEPSTLVTLGTGSLGLLAAFRRRLERH